MRVEEALKDAPTESAEDHWIHRIGLWASAICAVHCFLAAALAGVAPFLGFLKDERLELGFLAITIGLAVFALVSGLRLHRDARPIGLAAAALFPLLGARYAASALPDYEIALSVFGASLLIAAHLLNRRLIHSSTDHNCC